MNKLDVFSKRETLLLIVSFTLLILTLFVPGHSQIIAVSESGNLIGVVHAEHNAYFHLTRLGYWASSSVGCGILIVFGLIGVSALLGNFGIQPSFSIAIGAALYSIIVGIFGFDYLILASLTSIAWLILLTAFTDYSSLSCAVLLSVFIFLTWLLLYSLSLPILVVSIFIYSLIQQESFKLQTKITLALGCTVLFLLTLMTPNLTWPDYPISSRVTALLDGPAWLARPLIGEDLPFPTIDRGRVKELYKSLLLPLAIIFVFFITLAKKNKLAFRAWLSCAFTFVLAFLDIRLSEDWAQISPLQSLARLSPETILIPLTPIALALVVSGLILLFLLSNSKSYNRNFIIFAAAGIIFCLHPIKIEPALSENTPKEWSRSPSRNVTNFFSVDTLKMASSNWRSVRPKAQNLKITSQAQIEIDSKLLLDRNPNTRWSPGVGAQLGNEWIQVSFDNPQKIIGIELQTGDYKTDFPRGIKVKSSLDCSNLDTTPIASYESWQGSPQFTPLGYPYFSAQSEVKIFFSKEIETRCIKIEQTGQTPNFDWSIAEFKLIIKDEKLSSEQKD